MTGTVNRTWTALDGHLVFDFVITSPWSPDASVSVTVHGDPGSLDHQTLNVTASQPTRLDLRLALGVHVMGEIWLRPHALPDSIAIFGNLIYGSPRHESGHFAGAMAAFSSQEAPSSPRPG
jgi:hypothetical protein